MADTDPIRSDIDEILHQAVPRGVMAPALDIQKSHLAEVFPRLKTRLLELDGAGVDYERDPLGGDGWAAGDGPLPSGPAAPGPGDDMPASYYLLFLAATAEACRVGGGDTLTVGYSVALSVMAPTALVVLNHMESDDDDFSHSVPDVMAEEVELDSGETVAIDRFCCEQLATGGVEALERLRREITEVVEGFGFSLLPEEEQNKPIPWLEVPAMPFASPVRLSVRDALFFWAMAAR
jgi:hypothetical protein